MGATGVDEVIEKVEAECGDARTRLRRLFALASASGGELLKVELAIRDWARRDKAVGKRLRRVDNGRMDYMRSLFGAFCATTTRSRLVACSPSHSLSALRSSTPIMLGAAGWRRWNWPWDR